MLILKSEVSTSPKLKGHSLVSLCKLSLVNSSRLNLAKLTDFVTNFNGAIFEVPFNKPETYSRLYSVILLRGLLWFVIAMMLVYPLYLVTHSGIDLFSTTFSNSFMLPILLKSLVFFFGLISSNALAGLIFKHSKVAKEFEDTIHFDKVEQND